MMDKEEAYKRDCLEMERLRAESEEAVLTSALTNMRLHEKMNVDDNTVVVKVMSGWLYQYSWRNEDGCWLVEQTFVPMLIIPSEIK
jgi:hypothetical protein